MISLISIIFAVIVAILPSNLRCAQGYVSYLHYNEDSDSYTTRITTDDDMVWELEDYLLPRFDDVLVIFDTKGTDDVEDDEVKTVICFSSPDEDNVSKHLTNK